MVVPQHDEAENIGYVIPQPVIEHFISDFERNKKYTAFPLLGIEWQKTENPYLRKALGMKVRQVLLCILLELATWVFLTLA